MLEMAGNTEETVETAQRDEVFGDRCVLVTNGNLTSMIALSGWLKSHGSKILKIYVTYKLPSRMPLSSSRAPSI